MIHIITTPQILTDTIFTAYGGQTGTVPAALPAAYAIAEGQAAVEIGTFVAPTTVTGTFSWPPLGQPLQLPHTFLRNVVSVTAVHDVGCDCADDAVEIEGCAWILDNNGGTVSLRECENTVKAGCMACGCTCGRYGNGPYQARIVYTAGLPDNARSDPRLLLGLVTAASLALEQMTDPTKAEGGPGDPGVKSFSSLSYSETRTDASVRTSAFGNSARAAYAAKMLSNFKFNRAMKMGW